MSSSLHVLYITYRQASVSEREVFSMSEIEIEQFLIKFANNQSVEEAFVISTCNRTEIYWHGCDEAAVYARHLLSCVKKITPFDMSSAPLQLIANEAKAVSRFLRLWQAFVPRLWATDKLPDR